MSDDCLRILCNRRGQDTSLVLDTTAESPEGEPDADSPASSGSEPISDQDLRCARELAELDAGGAGDRIPQRRVLRQVSPLPRGLIISGNPVLNGENSGNAVFDRIGETPERLKATGLKGRTTEQLTFNGRIPLPPPPRQDHVVIQIEPDTSLGRVSLDGGAASAEEPAGDNVDNDDKDKSNAVEESFEFTNERSPDLFAENEEDDAEMEEDEEENRDDIETLDEEDAKDDVAVTTSAADRLMKRDNHLLKRLQTAFSGVLPPPSVTNVAISLDVIVSKYKEYNGQLPESKREENAQGENVEQEYLMKSVDSPSKAKAESWPELKNVICHDV